MNFFKLHFFSAILFISITCSSHAQTGDITPTASETEQPAWYKKMIDTAVNTTENIYDNGRLSLLLSGYAYHGRNTYTAERIAELNEKAWGLGVSKELRDEKDNEESLQFLIFSDSHYQPQINALYGYQWMKPLVSNWEVGAGYTAGLLSRADIIGSFPFPVIVPQFSLGTRDTKLIATYVPRLSNNKGNGDVLLLVLRVSLK